MQHIEYYFQSYGKENLQNLRKTLNRNTLEMADAICECWISLHKRFSCLKKVAYIISYWVISYMCVKKKKSYMNALVHKEICYQNIRNPVST